MLRSGQTLLKLLVLTGLGVDFVNTLKGKTGFLKSTSLRAACLFHTGKLTSRLGGARKRFAIRRERVGNAGARPCVYHAHMGGGIEQALMLVLAAKVNQRAHALGKLTHAGQAAVDARARATVGTQAARHHEALLIMRTREQATLHERALTPLTNCG